MLEPYLHMIGQLQIFGDILSGGIVLVLCDVRFCLLPTSLIEILVGAGVGCDYAPHHLT